MTAVKVRVPTARLVLDVVAGWVLAIGSSCWLLLLPRFDDQPRIVIAGEVIEVATPVVHNRQKALEFVLRGQTVRFRVWERIFAEALHTRVPANLVPGAQARATVEKAEYDKPRLPQPFKVPTVTVDALELGSTEVLALADSRAWHESNRKVGWVLAPVLCAMAAYLTVMLRRRLRKPALPAQA